MTSRCSKIPSYKSRRVNISETLRHLIDNKERLQKKGYISERRRISNHCTYVDLTMEEMQRRGDDQKVHLEETFNKINDLRNRFVDKYKITREELNQDFCPITSIKFNMLLTIDSL